MDRLDRTKINEIKTTTEEKIVIDLRFVSFQ